MSLVVGDKPGPFEVLPELRAFLHNPACQNPATNATWYLFARIARDNPILLREYEKLFQELPEGRPVLLRILGQAGDERTRTFLESCVANIEFAHSRADIEEALEDWAPGAIAPLTSPVTTAADLDILWCEFRATESTEPVRKIIDVLERPDHVRGKLEDWLHATARALPRRGFSALASILRYLTIRRLWKKASILCDADRQEVLSPQDLDCHLMMTGWDLDRERGVRLAKLLPFSLYGEDAYIGLKAVARWSLASHAHQYPMIFEFCESEAVERNGRCRILLLEIIAKAALAQDDLGKAFSALQESLTLDPATELRQSQKANAEWQRLSGLSLGSASLSPDTPSDARQAALRCVRATAAADTYRTKRLRVTNADRGEPGPGDISHECQFAQPDNFHVFQTMWEETGKVYDEWITTKAAHFRAPAWVNFTERSNRTLNSMLMAASYFGLLQRRKPARFGAYLCDGSHYLCFEYKNVPAHLPLPLWARFASFLIRCDALLWADFDTGRLAKVVLTVKPSRIMNWGKRKEITHFFSCYDDPVSIVPPAFGLAQATLPA